MSESARHLLPYVVIVNSAVVAALAIVLALIVRRSKLSVVPGAAQNAVELAFEWFLRLAKDAHPAGAVTIAPFLASLFIFILLSNLLAVLPLPLLRIPPTSYYGATAALALIAIGGVLVFGAKLEGLRGTLKHLFWPNPLQLVSEVSHALSLSLRLFGNIGGELLVATLIAAAVPYGLPLMIHLLGLVPAIVQPIVFTLLVANFIGEAVHTGGKG